MKEKLDNVPSLYSDLGMRIRRKYILFCKKIIPKLVPYHFDISGIENIPKAPVIYASTHQDFWDAINSIYACPDHIILLSASNIKLLMYKLLDWNGCVFVDRDNKQDRINAKLKLERVIHDGISIHMYPEATWNCSPNKLHLPLFKGVADIAKDTGAPIVPFIQEYSYDENKIDGKSHVVSVQLRFGTPIYANKDDSSIEVINKLSEEISTIRWNLREEKGICSRREISNILYTNYIRSRINDWRIPGNYIDQERYQVFGANDDFYLFHHVNDIPFNEQDEFLDTDTVSMLSDIYREHFDL